MSSTDLLNGPISGLPTYNVKNNPSIFNFNTVQKVNYFRQLLLAISFNHVFFDVVTDLKNMGRAYYNKNPRKFCSTIQLNAVTGFGGKEITVYLPAPGGFLDNSIQLILSIFCSKRCIAFGLKDKFTQSILLGFFSKICIAFGFIDNQFQLIFFGFLISKISIFCDFSSSLHLFLYF